MPVNWAYRTADILAARRGAVCDANFLRLFFENDIGSTGRAHGYSEQLPRRRGVEATAAEDAVEGVAPAGPDAVQLTYAKDGDWIRLKGEIVSTAPESFMLDYGTSSVLVEVGGWDWYQHGERLNPGDQVMVAGLVEKDPGSQSVEARGVYVGKLSTYFHARGADEEKLRENIVFAAENPRDGFTGDVISVDGREFTLRTAGKQVRVNTTGLPENPLDGEGLQQIKLGERVFVYGDLATKEAGGPTLMAKGIISLAEDRTKKI